VLRDDQAPLGNTRARPIGGDGVRRRRLLEDLHDEAGRESGEGLPAE
jgi:hypothetical protein